MNIYKHYFMNMITGIAIVSVMLVLLIACAPNSSSDNSRCEDFYGRWLYKYTYLDGDKLYYTEEDGMEQYIEVYEDGTYIYSDYAGDCVSEGKWDKSGDGIYLKEDDEQLDFYQDDMLRTQTKDGKKMMMPGDFYNVLVRKASTDN